MKTYHLTLRGEDGYSELRRQLKRFPARTSTVVSHCNPDTNIRTFEFIVNLAEDELICLKLCCPILNVVVENDEIRNEETTSFIGSILARM